MGTVTVTVAATPALSLCSVLTLIPFLKFSQLTLCYITTPSTTTTTFLDDMTIPTITYISQNDYDYDHDFTHMRRRNSNQNENNNQQKKKKSKSKRTSRESYKKQ